MLKRVKNKNDNWQHCCRWCRNYIDGICTNVDVQNSERNFQVAEEGMLSETLRETIGSVSLLPFKELEYLLRDYKMSEKRIKEFNSKFQGCIEQYHAELVEHLDEDISILYQNFESDSKEDGLEIGDPERFVCNNWR